MPSVSLMMPVFNALKDFERGNGFFMLPLALESLLNQSFKDFDLIILDNQSTDGTFEFLQKIAKTDSRIILIRDSRKRNPEEAISFLGTLVQSNFCCIVNDDDLWDENFLQLMFDEISQHNYDLVYPNGAYIDVKGIKLHPLVDDSHPFYTKTLGLERNVEKYLTSRNPIPVSFGLFRSNLFNRLYPSLQFDSYRANVDNIFILRLLLNDLNIHFVNEPLFFYREKIRFLNVERDLGLPSKASIIEIYERLLLHQVKFHFAILDEIYNSPIDLDIARLSFLSYRSLVSQLDYMFLFVLQQKDFSRADFLKMSEFRDFCLKLLLADQKNYSSAVVQKTLSGNSSLTENLLLAHEAQSKVAVEPFGMSTITLGMRVRKSYWGYKLVENPFFKQVAKLIKNIRQ